MTDSEYTRIKKMKNLIETLNRPEEHIVDCQVKLTHFYV